MQTPDSLSAQADSSSMSSPLSNLLNLPEQPQKLKKTGKARVLTSQECLQILKENQKKKQEAAEMKAKRLEERLEKKKKREEDLQRKKEEKIRKKAEREAAKAEKEAAREAAKLKREAAAKLTGMKRVKSKRGNNTRKKARIEVEVDADICCVCFGSYEDDRGTDRDWIQCKCNRWIHEDCVDFEDCSEDGVLCPLC